jgi:hypothetical protein
MIRSPAGPPVGIAADARTVLARKGSLAPRLKTGAPLRTACRSG